MLVEGTPMNSYFVIVGELASQEQDSGIRRLAISQCSAMKREFNMDLMRATFTAERPHNKRPEREGIRLPGKAND
jgi:hypothetical protein